MNRKKLEYNKAEQVLPGRGGSPPIMYTHVSKCKSDKIKFKFKKDAN
jgi:hypothetical protein